MKRILLGVLFLGCSERAAPPAAVADAATQDATTPAEPGFGFQCCVDGRNCITSERVRWCALSDAGPPGTSCVLPDQAECYMRTTDAGIEEVFYMTNIAPESARPEGVSLCDEKARSYCP